MDGGERSHISVYRRDDALGNWMVASCAPLPALAPFVAQLWYGEGRVFYQRDRILPNSGSFLLINLGPTQYRILPGPPEQRIAFDDIWYSGLQQTPIETEAPHGNALLGVAFTPAGARAFLHADAHHFADRVLPLTDILGDGALRLRERLLECVDPASRFGVVEAWLQQRLQPKLAPHALVPWALQRIAASGGQTSVEALAKEAGVTRRHLAGLFMRDVGLSPKTLARLQRFNAALALLQGRDRVPWAELAALCGYFDQSHLVHDFRIFSGFAPGEFLRHARADALSVVVE